MKEPLIFEEESFVIRGALYEVYKTLGNGFLEEVYQNAVEEEMRQRKIDFEPKRECHVMYKGKDCGLYMPDFICYNKIIVELKAVEILHQRHHAQVINYLKATGFKLALRA